MIVSFTLDPDNLPQLTPEEAARLDAMTDEEINAAALSDPDNPPSTDEELAQMDAVIAARNARKAAGMSQMQFANAFHINVSRLRDLEQGRHNPDRAVVAYLRVIARDPKAALAALAD